MKTTLLLLSSLLAALCTAEQSFVLFDFDDIKDGALPPGIEVLNGADDAGSVVVVSSEVVGSQSLQLVGDLIGSDGRGYRSMAAIKLSRQFNTAQYERFQAALSSANKTWSIQFDLWINTSSMSFFKLEFGLNSTSGGYQKAGGASFLNIKEKDLNALGIGVRYFGKIVLQSTDFANPILQGDTFYNFTFKQNSKAGMLPAFYVDNIEIFF